MNLLLFQIIVLALAAAIQWDANKCKDFCTRVEPLIHRQEISQEEIDLLIEEFDIPVTTIPDEFDNLVDEPIFTHSVTEL